MSEVTQIAWLAGLLEGEGTFGTSHRVFVQVGMTDRDVMERVAVLLGGNLRGPYDNGGRGRKPIFYVAVYGSTAASWMMTLWSFMGTRRRAQIKCALQRWRKQRTNRTRLGVRAIINDKQNPEYTRLYNEKIRAPRKAALHG